MRVALMTQVHDAEQAEGFRRLLLSDGLDFNRGGRHDIIRTDLGKWNQEDCSCVDCDIQNMSW
jgi:hypothetical protein